MNTLEVSEDSWIALAAKAIISKTDKAALVELLDGSQHWVPESQIRIEDNFLNLDPAYCFTHILVTKWFACVRGWLNEKDVPQRKKKRKERPLS